MLYENNNAPQSKLIPLPYETINLLKDWLGINGDGRLRCYIAASIVDQTVIDDLKTILFEEVVNQTGHETTKRAVKKYITSNE
jgi:hypothetical protein